MTCTSPHVPCHHCPPPRWGASFPSVKLSVPSCTAHQPSRNGAGARGGCGESCGRQGCVLVADGWLRWFAFPFSLHGDGQWYGRRQRASLRSSMQNHMQRINPIILKLDDAGITQRPPACCYISPIAAQPWGGNVARRACRAQLPHIRHSSRLSSRHATRADPPSPSNTCGRHRLAVSAKDTALPGPRPHIMEHTANDTPAGPQQAQLWDGPRLTAVTNRDHNLRPVLLCCSCVIISCGVPSKRLRVDSKLYGRRSRPCSQVVHSRLQALKGDGGTEGVTLHPGDLRSVLLGEKPSASSRNGGT